MALDFHDRGSAALTQRQHRGRRNHLSGVAAEGAVERLYREAGLQLLERRWRGAGGEIDLIFQEQEGTVVFVEVKSARDFDRAMGLITPAQVTRIHRTAEEYLGLCPAGLLTETRFDAALVDARGHVRIEENALLGY